MDRRTRHLTQIEAVQAVTLVGEGRSFRYVARVLGVHHTTIIRVVQRFRETGTHARRPGQGRHRATSQRDDDFLRLNILRDRTSTSRSLNDLIREVRHVHISDRTVRRRFHEANLRSRRPATGPLLTRQHRVDRFRFARQYVGWNLNDWRRVLFTDETRIALRSPDGRSRVWRREGERFAQACISPREPFAGGSFMFWGGISYDARTELVPLPRPALNARRYILEIIEEHVVPFAPFIGPDFLLMHDNARPHVAADVVQYLDEVRITTLDWPPRSPDLNAIEHIWDLLKKRIRRRNHPPQTLGELEEAAREEWENIPQETIQNLIRGMPRRLQAVIAARGGNTRY